MWSQPVETHTTMRITSHGERAARSGRARHTTQTQSGSIPRDHSAAPRSLDSPDSVGGAPSPHAPQASARARRLPEVTWSALCFILAGSLAAWASYGRAKRRSTIQPLLQPLALPDVKGLESKRLPTWAMVAGTGEVSQAAEGWNADDGGGLLLIVDGSNFLHRAYHSIPPLTNAQGAPVNAIYGVTNMIRQLLDSRRPTHMVVTFDAPGATFRHEMHEDYKANRPPMQNDLVEQIEPLQKLIAAMGIQVLSVRGVEADDVIGTLATLATQQQLPTVIASGDKDLAQLVNATVSLLDPKGDPKKSDAMDAVEVQQKFGVPPNLIVDLLALQGDKVDNIPGIPGVGPKTALALLQNIGGLEAIYGDLEAIANIKGLRGAKTLGAKLAEQEDVARLSHKLATIRCDVDLGGIGVDQLRVGERDVPALKNAGFKFLTQWADVAPGADAVDAKDREAGVANEAPETAVEYTTISSKEELLEWIQKLDQATEFALSVHTDGGGYMDAELVGLALAVAPGRAAYLPLRPLPPALADRDWVLAQLQPLLEAPRADVIGHDAKYLRNVLRTAAGVRLGGTPKDTQLQSYVLNSAAAPHTLEKLALLHLDAHLLPCPGTAGKAGEALGSLDPEVVGPWAAERADATLRVHAAMRRLLQAKGAGPLCELLEGLEYPLLGVLSELELTGVLLVPEALRAQQAEEEARLQAVAAEAYDLVGEEFNLNSPKQLRTILFEKLGLPTLKSTPKGVPSTAAGVIEELATEHQLPRLLLEHRTLSRRMAYATGLPDHISARDGRVHTTYQQAVTATGRLSSSDPNLQNIPAQEDGRWIRRAFVAPEGHRLISADYSQIELRVMAHMSQDPGMCTAFRENRDIHTATAAELFKVDPADVTGAQRRKAKAVNFGLIYGMKAYGLSRQLKIPHSEAQEYVTTYFERYPGVQKYMNEVVAGAVADGYVETLLGRRIYVHDIQSRSANTRQAAERLAINAPIQGTAADVIKKAMLVVHAWLQERPELGSRMIMQVHDELVLEVPEAHVDAVLARVCELMTEALPLDVPVVVNAASGQNWADTH